MPQKINFNDISITHPENDAFDSLGREAVIGLSPDGKRRVAK
jgi:hypothetical protein